MGILTDALRLPCLSVRRSCPIKLSAAFFCRSGTAISKVTLAFAQRWDPVILAFVLIATLLGVTFKDGFGLLFAKAASERAVRSATSRSIEATCKAICLLRPKTVFPAMEGRAT